MCDGHRRSRRLLTSVVVLGLCWQAAVLRGQGPAEGPSSAGGRDASARETLDAAKLGVSIQRIRTRLTRDRTFATTFDPARLKLATYVEVAAKAPPFRLFGPEALRDFGSRAVPGGPPTTREMLDVVKERRR